jgi:drug/metabolite transporter (DMT)-like permease
VAAATTSSAALLMLPFAIARWPEQPVSGEAWFSAVMLGVICTGIAYALYYRLVKRVGPGRSVVVTYRCRCSRSAGRGGCWASR